MMDIAGLNPAQGSIPYLIVFRARQKWFSWSEYFHLTIKF